MFARPLFQHLVVLGQHASAPLHLRPSIGITAMGKGKKKAAGAASGAGGDNKAARAAVETIVNNAVQLQV